MNNVEVIKVLASKLEITQKDAKVFVETLCDIIFDNIGEGVTLGTLGKFSMKDKAERQGRNPKTGEAINIPSRSVPAFKFGSGTKKELTEVL